MIYVAVFLWLLGVGQTWNISTHHRIVLSKKKLTFLVSLFRTKSHSFRRMMVEVTVIPCCAALRLLSPHTHTHSTHKTKSHLITINVGSLVEWLDCMYHRYNVYGICIPITATVHSCAVKSTKTFGVSQCNVRRFTWWTMDDLCANKMRVLRIVRFRIDIG